MERAVRNVNETNPVADIQSAEIELTELELREEALLCLCETTF